MEGEYTYPFRAGSEEWKNKRTHDELRPQLQIPENVIVSLNTQSLLNSVLRYPLIGDLLVYSSFQKGVDQLRINFAAFDHLLKRRDATEALLLVYESYNPSDILSLKDPIEIGEFMLQITLLEFIAGHEAIVSGIGKEQARKLQRQLISKYERKFEAKDRYGDLGLSTGLWALTRITDAQEAVKIGNSNFRENGHTLSFSEQAILKKRIEDTINK